MKNALQCIGSIMYGTFYGVLMYLLFHWLTPMVMNMKLGLFLLVLLVGEMLFVSILNFASSLLTVPQLLITQNNKVAKVLGVLPIIISGVLSIVCVWTLNGDYKLAHWIIGISLTFTIFASYAGTIGVLLKEE